MFDQPQPDFDNIDNNDAMPGIIDNENLNIDEIVLEGESWLWSIYSIISKGLWNFYLYISALLFLSFFVGKSCTVIITTIFILKHLSFSSNCLVMV
jgi:hypothetical protein